MGIMGCVLVSPIPDQDFKVLAYTFSDMTDAVCMFQS
jgi:hypothetical protein